MSKPTKGPWIYDIHDGSFYIFTASDMEMVADGDPDDVGIARMRGVGRGADSAEQEANARIIAAAPDLLDACQSALLTLNINRRRITCEPLEAKLRAALAKAEGAK